jgi:hypothetical protein
MSLVEYNNAFEKFCTLWIDYAKNWNDLLIRYNVTLADALSDTIHENSISYQDFFPEDFQSKLSVF